MADDFKIRPARRFDREGVAELLREAGYADGADTNTMFWVLNHPEIDVFVAADSQERPVGYVSLSHRPQLRLRGRIVTIDELVVGEAWRDSEVGDRLLETAVERAKALSAKRIEVSALDERSTFRIDFWSKNGFQETDGKVLRYSKTER
ncbi:MAG: GNAT family N-acetyltransferase [Myxococcales bacterium]